jgi:hypothetical protein
MVDMPIRIRGREEIVEIQPAQVDAYLRAYAKISLKDWRYGMELPILPRAPCPADIENRLRAMWQRRSETLPPMAKEAVNVLTREGIEFILAVKLILAAGNDINRARELWSSTAV